MKKMKKAKWSDLPEDIWRLIMEKLCWSERVPLCLVCKIWRDCIREIKNTKEFLPWLMYYDKGRKGNCSICKLCDPSAKRIFTVKQTQIARNRDLVPHQSRHGWVLFSKGFFGLVIKHLFLYSPFTNQVIELPKLNKIYSKASFSLSPTCPDCMVIALRIPKTGELEIKAWQPGYETWKTFKFSGEYDIISQVAYAGESFYCVFSDLKRNVKKIGAFNTKHQEWQEFSGSIEVNNEPNRVYLSVAINGDLLLVTTLAQSGRISGFQRFHLSNKKWFVVENDTIMEKQVTFIGGTSFSVPAMGNARQSAGLIIGSTPVLRCYNCLVTQQWWQPPQYPQVYDWINKNDYNKLKRIWIQPPF
ncbi:hypothetical protein EZV62_007486 [Acer yangbiense]|uniref:F-box domain-containing protein n=1 Tax=Acer yangbiense TaxID=1000413 RepID=A0A5C7IAU8_9ROSI|nr:hypothetical protein EZV62_007486 [Acer yangbiense]